MPYRLNPDLVRQTIYRDPQFPYHEQAVFLRDPHVIPGGYEPGIGEVIVDDVREDLELAAEWNEVGRLMEGETTQPQVTRVFRTRGCFEFSDEDEVILIIDSLTAPLTTISK